MHGVPSHMSWEGPVAVLLIFLLNSTTWIVRAVLTPREWTFLTVSSERFAGGFMPKKEAASFWCEAAPGCISLSHIPAW